MSLKGKVKWFNGKKDYGMEMELSHILMERLKMESGKKINSLNQNNK